MTSDLSTEEKLFHYTVDELIEYITDVINAPDPAKSVLTYSFIRDDFPTVKNNDDMNSLSELKGIPTTFQLKPAVSWTTDDVRDWMYVSAVESCDESGATDGSWDIRQMSGERWQDIDGRRLCSMPASEFRERDPRHGQLLYDLLHRHDLIHESLGQDNDDVFFDDLFVTGNSDDNGGLPSIGICTTPSDSVSTDSDLIGNVNNILLGDYNTVAMTTTAFPGYEFLGGLPGIGIFITSPGSADAHQCESSSTDNDQIGDVNNIFFSDDNNSVAMTTAFSGYDPTETESYEAQSPNLTCNEVTLHKFLVTMSSSEVDPTSGIVSSSKCRRPRKPGRSTTTATRVRSSASARAFGGGDLTRRRMSSDSCSYSSDDTCCGSETCLDSSSVTIIRRKTKKRAVHLWQFMLSLLDDERYNPGCVKWLNTSEGVFRIVNSTEIARLWGIKKNNRSMTFEKMSRSLRWSRDNGFLSDVPKNSGYPKKLCFRFGELAENWYNSPSAISGCLGN